MTEKGEHVYFAKPKEDATRYILQVAQSKNARKVVKSKSMVTERSVSIMRCRTPASGDQTHRVIILQLDQDPPSHVVVPAIHKHRLTPPSAARRWGTTAGNPGSDDLIHPAKPQGFPQCRKRYYRL
ncbi:hypothetical protein ACLK1T_05730 [Escherichia coli]